MLFIQSFLRFSHLRRASFASRIIRNEQFFLGQAQDGPDKPVMLEARFVSQRLVVRFIFEQLLCRLSKRCCDQFCFLCLNASPLPELTNSRRRKVCRLRQFFLAYLLFLHQHRQIHFRLRSTRLLTNPRLHEIFIKRIQVVGPDILKFHVPDGRDNPPQEESIPIGRALLQSLTLLYTKEILCILFKRNPVVHLITLCQFFFELKCYASRFFISSAFFHSIRRLERHVMTHLFSLFRTTAGYRNFIADTLVSDNLFNSRHSSLLID